MLVSLAGLPACIADVRDALTTVGGSVAPVIDPASIVARVEYAAAWFPPLYRQTVLEPLLVYLRSRGAWAWPPELDAVVDSVLQRAEGTLPLATRALQEVVSDLYDGFLGMEDRIHVKLPETDILAPLVRWVDDPCQIGSYTSETMLQYRIGAGVVSLPGRAGLLAWGALSHEACGHDVLCGDVGLLPEIQQAVAVGLWRSGHAARAAAWSEPRVQEAAADVVGVLNLGPAAALSLIGYFRGVQWAGQGAPVLSSSAGTGVHPASLLRGWMAAAVVERLRFRGAAAWAARLRRELARDTPRDASVHADIAAAEVVARVIAGEPRAALEGHTLADIQNWYDADEARALDLGVRLAAGDWTTRGLDAQTYAAHVVSGAIVAAAAWGQPDLLGRGMQHVLADMHAHNPSWGPLGVSHPGDLMRSAV